MRLRAVLQCVRPRRDNHPMHRGAPFLLLASLACAACLDVGDPPPQPAPRPAPQEGAPDEQSVGEPGWELSGGARKSYALHADVNAMRNGHAAWLLEPVGDTSGKYATWMRRVEATPYLGKRVRVSASL